MATAGVAANWLARLLKRGLALVGIAVLVAGFTFGRSDAFKAECAAHKVFDYDMGTFENFICDVSFDIST